MENNSFKKMAKALSAALIDEFRGWLVEKNGEVIRVEVPKDLFHPQIAYNELSEDPDWKYVSGIGQDCVVDFMNYKKATYITKIAKDASGTDFQWTAGYLKDVYNEDAQFRGKTMKQYEILCQIINGLGYDAEEYSFNGEKNSNGIPQVDIKTIQSNIEKIAHSKNHYMPKRKMQDGDTIKFDKFGNPVAVESNGKWHNINNYPELSPKSRKEDDELEK